METSLLDLPISFFEYDQKRGTFANTPSQQTSLRRIVSTRYYQAIVETICAEPDKAKQDELKKQLPSFTPVALLRHRKKDTSFEERIIHQWPMGTGDIDTKENPGVDMSELKQQIASLPYVLLCAYSVRRGLWFVVRLPDDQTPDTLAAHFRYLQRLFTGKFGIKLDSTKGSNPTALRFVSCDLEPYFNDEATIMEGTYTPPQPTRPTVEYNQPLNEDSTKLLQRLLKPVQNAGEGGRHEALLKASRLGGGMIAANRLDEQTVVLALETEASLWPNFDKSQKTIRDGIKHGLLSPVYPDIREVPVAWKIETRRPKHQAQTVEHVANTETYTDERWKPFEYAVSVEETKPTEEIFSDEARKVEPSKPVESAPAAFRLPRLIEEYYQKFSRPPLWFNLIRQHKALLRLLIPNQPKEIVTSSEEQWNSPGSIIRPGEHQLQRYEEEPCDHYSPVLDEPKDLVPTINQIYLKDQLPAAPRMTFFEWQRIDPHFSKLGLASLNKQPDIPWRNDESTID